MSFYPDSTPRPSPQTVVLFLLENSPAMHRRFHEVRDGYIPSILREMRLSEQTDVMWSVVSPFNERRRVSPFFPPQPIKFMGTCDAFDSTGHPITARAIEHGLKLLVSMSQRLEEPLTRHLVLIPCDYSYDLSKAEVDQLAKCTAQQLVHLHMVLSSVNIVYEYLFYESARQQNHLTLKSWCDVESATRPYCLVAYATTSVSLEAKRQPPAQVSGELWSASSHEVTTVPSTTWPSYPLSAQGFEYLSGVNTMYSTLAQASSDRNATLALAPTQGAWRDARAAPGIMLIGDDSRPLLRCTNHMSALSIEPPTIADTTNLYDHCEVAPNNFPYADWHPQCGSSYQDRIPVQRPDFDQADQRLPIDNHRAGPPTISHPSYINPASQIIPLVIEHQFSEHSPMPTYCVFHSSSSSAASTSRSAESNDGQCCSCHTAHPLTQPVNPSFRFPSLDLELLVAKYGVASDGDQPFFLDPDLAAEVLADDWHLKTGPPLFASSKGEKKKTQTTNGVQKKARQKTAQQGLKWINSGITPSTTSAVPLDSPFTFSPLLSSSSPINSQNAPFILPPFNVSDPAVGQP